MKQESLKLKKVHYLYIYSEKLVNLITEKYHK